MRPGNNISLPGVRVTMSIHPISRISRGIVLTMNRKAVVVVLRIIDGVGSRLIRE